MNGRFIAYISPAAWVKGHGHRVSMVVENEAGHNPTGNTPEGGMVEPWYWGDPNDAAKSYEMAEKTAEEYNKKLGYSEKDVSDIFLSSMRLARV